MDKDRCGSVSDRWSNIGQGDRRWWQHTNGLAVVKMSVGVTAKELFEKGFEDGDEFRGSPRKHVVCSMGESAKVLVWKTGKWAVEADVMGQWEKTHGYCKCTVSHIVLLALTFLVSLSGESFQGLGFIATPQLLIANLTYLRPCWFPWKIHLLPHGDPRLDSCKNLMELNTSQRKWLLSGLFCPLETVTSSPSLCVD